MLGDNMKKDIRKSLISLGLFINILLTSGCSKTVDCNIEGNHIHKYRNSIGIERYVLGEKDYVHNINEYIYYRTDEYVKLDSENEQIYRIISVDNLVSIDDNKEKLYVLSDNLKDYYIFEYYYYVTEYDTKTVKNADGSTSTEIEEKKVKKYDWTTDPHHKNLTGDKEVMTNVFYGYAISYKDGVGYRVIKGGPVDDIRILEEMGYKYVSSNLYSSMERDDYLKKVGLYKHVKNSDLKPVYVIDNGEYILYSEYVLKR